jgi:protein-tyrosine-phosphatase
MYPEIQKFIEARKSEFNLIPDERKILLQGIANYVQKKIAEKKQVQLVYICIHNSRRSHFGQVAASVAAAHYHLNLDSYSGGTVATAFNPNAIAALQKIGFSIDTSDTSENPHYQVYFQDRNPVVCFSKVYDDAINPTSNFAAIMTCGEAEENCPFIPNAEFKTSTTYEDPTASDGTGKELEVYTDRFAQILRETLYAFSLLEK